MRPARQATARVNEKLTALGLRVDDPWHGALRRLEAPEAIAPGILGKQARRHTPARATAVAPHLGFLEVAPLSRQRVEQYAIVESLRVQAAVDTLGGD